MRKRAFLICPVRGADKSSSQWAVEMLEDMGWEVHWPHRDTDQDDPVGMRICRDNLAAIRAADKVFVVWDGASQGCLFDLGAAFALGKPLGILRIPPDSPGKGFQKVMRAWEAHGIGP